MPLKIQTPSPQQLAFRNDVVEVMRKHKDLRAVEMLAMASHVVGQIVAMQDQRNVTPQVAMEIVARNLEQGNKDALDGVLKADEYGPKN